MDFQRFQMAHWHPGETSPTRRNQSRRSYSSDEDRVSSIYSAHTGRPNFDPWRGDLCKTSVEPASRNLSLLVLQTLWSALFRVWQTHARAHLLEERSVFRIVLDCGRTLTHREPHKNGVVPFKCSSEVWKSSVGLLQTHIGLANPNAGISPLVECRLGGLKDHMQQF